MPLPQRIYAHATPPSVGGISLFDVGKRLYRKTVRSVLSPHSLIRAAWTRLAAAGFEILSVTPLSINFAGTPDLFEKSFRTKIIEKEVELARGATSTYLDSPDTD